MSSINDGRFTVNATADAVTANRFVRLIEDTHARRLGVRVQEVRQGVAHRLRAPAGTLENIRRLRKKVVPHWLMARLRSELVATLTQEVQRLENEINLAREAGMGDRDDALAAAAAQLASAKSILRGATDT